MRGLSPPGLLFAAFGATATALPFVTLRANRIVAGDGIAIWNAAGPGTTAVGLAAIAAGLACGAAATRPVLRLAGAVTSLAGVLLLASRGATTLLGGAGDLARVSPGAGFWCLLAVALLLLADAVAGMRPGPRTRLSLLGAALLALAVLLGSGALDALSPMQEYAVREPEFRRAALRHVALAFGSLAAAAAIGVPLGIVCHRRAGLRGAALPVLSFVQTVPSLAMFGLMIPILGWIGATVPGARQLGIAGIGFAPAFLALLLYSLLPVVANLVTGLAAVPAAAVEAARGMGMTPRQRLWRVEFPLALPVVLTGLRIVLVQNIGLAVIAGLIGGGGFGTFVFQGLSQTATDLILMGALPTVAMALVAAIAMDVLVDIARPVPKGTAR